MIEILLNSFSALFAIAATSIGVKNGDTWSKEKKRPTQTGFIVIGLACLTAIMQIGVQINQWREIKSAQDGLEKAYNGWISVGVYDENTNKWDVFFLLDLKTPEEISINNRYFLRRPQNIRIKPPDYCPDIDNVWFGEDAKTQVELPGGGEIEIVEVKPYPNCGRAGQVPGKVRVTANIVLKSFP